MDSNLLVDAVPEKIFYLFNGIPIRNLPELVSALDSMTYGEFSAHCNESKDDFASWIEYVLMLKDLASVLREIKDKDRYAKVIKKALAAATKQTKSESSSAIIPVIKSPEIQEIDNTSKDQKEKVKVLLSEKSSKEISAELKAEVRKAMALNTQLTKKLELMLSNNTAETKKLTEKSIALALNAQFSEINKKIDKLLETRMSKVEQSFKSRTDTMSSSNLQNFKKMLNDEKNSLKAVAADVMDKEFSRLLNNDEYIRKIVSKYQDAFNESAENAQRMHRASEDQFNDKLTTIKNMTAIETQNILNKQLADTIKKQREFLDSELAKTVNSNKHFISRFENEIISREKLFMESADRKLTDNYVKHAGLLEAEFNKITNELNNLNLQFYKEFKSREAQFAEAMTSKIHTELNKEFDDVLVNKRSELSQAIDVEKSAAINRMNTEFGNLLSKHKQAILEQFNKAAVDQIALKNKFVEELKAEQTRMMVNARELMQTELRATVKDQRTLMDSELAKTIESNKFFIRRFEKDILGMTAKLSESENKMLNDAYSKHNKLLQEEFEKKTSSLNKIITDANTNFANKEAQIYTNVNATVPAAVRDSVNREFSRLIQNEKNALDAELKKAEEINKTIIETLETTLQEKAKEIISVLLNDANAKFNDLISAQETKLNHEIIKIKESLDYIEAKKKDIIEKTDVLIDTIHEDSANKLKELEQEHDRHLKKVSQLNSLITKTEKALTEIKELKTELKDNKKTASKESEEYSNLITELNALKEEMAQEKEWMTQYRTKANFYSLINNCREYIKSKDARNARATYNKIAEEYSKATLNKEDKLEIYNTTKDLLSELQKI